MSLQDIKTKLRDYNNKRLRNKPQFQRSVNRSKKGDFGIFFMLGVVAIVMVLPMVYAICQSLKPLEHPHKMVFG